MSKYGAQPTNRTQTPTNDVSPWRFEVADDAVLVHACCFFEARRNAAVLLGADPDDLRLLSSLYSR